MVWTGGPLALVDGVHLAEWQANAVERWRDARHPTRGRRHGIIEAVTGTGKTLAAIACIVDAVAEVPDLRVAVVVPAQQLARQWAQELMARLGLTEREVGLRMTGSKASLRTHRIVVWVIDSARTALAKDCEGLQVLLVVDECHRSGSGKNLQIYRAPTRFRLGLSATAQRQGEVDEDGVLLPLERQAHARELGPTLEPRLTVAVAERMGILPPFKLVHHGLSLSPAEQEKDFQLSRSVTHAASHDELGALPAEQAAEVLAEIEGQLRALEALRERLLGGRGG